MKLVRNSLYSAIAASILLQFVITSTASAHCQIPCGIYGDTNRFEDLYEHITTIEKSMNEINKLSEAPNGNENQLTRWVLNKEQHADEIAEIITQYFLQQRIKPEEAKSDHGSWMKKVTALHHMLVSSMKAKQTTDLQHVADLREHLDAFAAAYLSKEDLDHLKEHHAH